MDCYLTLEYTQDAIPLSGKPPKAYKVVSYVCPIVGDTKDSLGRYLIEINLDTLPDIALLEWLADSHRHAVGSIFYDCNEKGTSTITFCDARCLSLYLACVRNTETGYRNVTKLRINAMITTSGNIRI